MNFISQYYTQKEVEQHLRKRFEKNSESLNTTCPFCNSIFKSKFYIKKHINIFCCAIDNTNSLFFSTIYEKVFKEFSKRKPKQHGHQDDPLLSKFDKFLSWEYCENSDARKQLQYRILLDDESIVIIKHSELTNSSRMGIALAKKAQRLRKNDNLPFIASNNCGNNRKELKSKNITESLSPKKNICNSTKENNDKIITTCNLHNENYKICNLQNENYKTCNLQNENYRTCNLQNENYKTCNLQNENYKT